MKRRECLTIPGSAVAWPLAAHAQQPTMPVIGFLNGASYELSRHLVQAFHQGLGETGYVEGRNVTVEYRSAEGQYDRLPSLAADLVRHKVDVIVATGTPTGLPAKAATTTIPIVFVTGSDPVEQGLITNLAHPEGTPTNTDRPREVLQSISQFRTRPRKRGPLENATSLAASFSSAQWCGAIHPPSRRPVRA